MGNWRITGCFFVQPLCACTVHNAATSDLGEKDEILVFAPQNKSEMSSCPAACDVIFAAISSQGNHALRESALTRCD